MAQRIGVDVGGTNIKIALVSDEGKIIYSNSIPTRAEMGYEYTVNSMKEAIRELLKETKLEAKDIEGMTKKYDKANSICYISRSNKAYINGRTFRNSAREHKFSCY